MITVIEGDITNATEDIIGHQVNCQAAMGSGVAKALMGKYPTLKSDYLKFCKTYDTPEDRLGKLHIVELTSGRFPRLRGKKETKIIAHLFTQLEYGREEGKLYTNYDKLEQALTILKHYAQNRGLSVCLPYGIGCGLANGDWGVVSAMIERAFEDYKVTLYKLI
jgi:O-acetyl-ADP-ribose deacetylase (regulator of RNase III)